MANILNASSALRLGGIEGYQSRD